MEMSVIGGGQGGAAKKLNLKLLITIFLRQIMRAPQKIYIAGIKLKRRIQLAQYYKCITKD